MRTLKNFFGKFAGRGFRRYCTCGHAVSANLAFCPHCGARLSDPEILPER